MSMTIPIVDFVRSYAQSGTARLHMPGHKGQSLLGFEPLDITEISGADELYARAEVIDSQPHRADSGAQRRRIRRRSDRQLIQSERRAEKRREQRRRAKQRPALPQILREFHRYPT